MAGRVAVTGAGVAGLAAPRVAAKWFGGAFVGAAVMTARPRQGASGALRPGQRVECGARSHTRPECLHVH